MYVKLYNFEVQINLILVIVWIWNGTMEPIFCFPFCFNANRFLRIYLFPILLCKQCWSSTSNIIHIHLQFLSCWKRINKTSKYDIIPTFFQYCIKQSFLNLWWICMLILLFLWSISICIYQCIYMQYEYIFRKIRWKQVWISESYV